MQATKQVPFSVSISLSRRLQCNALAVAIECAAEKALRVKNANEVKKLYNDSFFIPFRLISFSWLVSLYVCMHMCGESKEIGGESAPEQVHEEKQVLQLNIKPEERTKKRKEY